MELKSSTPPIALRRIEYEAEPIIRGVGIINKETINLITLSGLF
jgi:hypothetical protein